MHVAQPTRSIRDAVSAAPLWHIFVLVGFSVAQPVFGLLRNGPEFFVAHNVGAVGLWAFVLAVAWLLPATLIVLLWGIGRRWPAARGHAFGTLLVLATAAFVMHALRGVDWPGALIVLCGMAAGAALLYTYAKVEAARWFVSMLVIVALVFPGAFLFSGAVRPLWWEPSEERALGEPRGPVAITEPHPVVLVVFDELSLPTMLDSTGELDAVRFPNFAALAATSTWFPRAVATDVDTTMAIPAILTGRRPDPARRLPTAATHPRNLFSLLAGSYELNVHEHVTALCAPEPSTRGPVHRLAAGMLVRDVGIAYLHLLAPAAWATRLPSIAHGWRNFGGQVELDSTAAAEAADVNERFTAGILRGRADRVGRFMASIGGNPRSLSFFHSMLPHHPYQYDPAGALYSAGENAEGLTNDGSWMADEPLVEVGYGQYLLQLGFVDTLVGRLIARLREVGLFDDALLIITADHGVSFKPGLRRRQIQTETAVDILRVPMFVKLPGQREEGRSDRVVSGIDVLPTITAVLGIDEPWSVDGASMVGDDFPEREDVTVRTFGGEPVTFEVSALFAAADPRPSVAAKLGERQPLDRLAVHLGDDGPVGRLVADLIVEQDAADIRADFVGTGPGVFDAVDLEGSFVPLLLRCNLVGGAAGDTIAVAVNGAVVSEVRAVEREGIGAYVTALLPRASLREGRNAIELFRVGDGGRLAHIPTRPTLQLIAENDTEALVGDDVRIPVGPKKPPWGYVGSFIAADGGAVLEGWAGDLDAGLPARSVLFVVDGRELMSFRPDRGWPSVVRALGQEGLLFSGFRAVLSLSVVPTNPFAIRLYGISNAGEAREIDFSRERRCALYASMLEAAGRSPLSEVDDRCR